MVCDYIIMDLSTSTYNSKSTSCFNISHLFVYINAALFFFNIAVSWYKITFANVFLYNFTSLHCNTHSKLSLFNSFDGLFQVCACGWRRQKNTTNHQTYCLLHSSRQTSLGAVKSIGRISGHLSREVHPWYPSCEFLSLGYHIIKADLVFPPITSRERPGPWSAGLLADGNVLVLCYRFFSSHRYVCF